MVHGGGDQVTCKRNVLMYVTVCRNISCLFLLGPEISREFHNRCSSKDKTFKLYEACWHNMMFGEADEQAAIIFNDVSTWIEARSA